MERCGEVQKEDRTELCVVLAKTVEQKYVFSVRVKLTKQEDY